MPSKWKNGVYPTIEPVVYIWWASLCALVH